MTLGRANKSENMDNSSIEDSIEELEHRRKLFIGGLHPHTTSGTLQEYFGKFGKVLEAKVMKDQTGKSRGFGFITYARANMVDEAQKGRPHEINGKEVQSKRLVPSIDITKPESRVTVKKLFVGGIRNEHDEDCLKKYFGKFGNIIAINVAVDPNTGKRKGFAFIAYDDYDSVDRALLQKLHCLKGVLLDVKKALTKRMAERLNQGMPTYGNPNFNGPPQNMSPNQMPRNSGLPNNLPANNMPHNNPQSWSTGYNGNSGNTWNANDDNTGAPGNNWNSGQNTGWNPNGAGGVDNWGNNNNQYPQQTPYSGPRRNYSSGRVNPYPDTKNINLKHTGNRGQAANMNNNDTWQYNQPGNTGNWNNQHVPGNTTWNNNPSGPNQGPPVSGGYSSAPNVNYGRN